ncbi:DNA repair protein RadC [bacterium]|nr:DNA repair protein RadC [bacterium]
MNSVEQERQPDAEMMPREKLMAHGAAALADADLLAIVLNTGYRGEPVRALAGRLLKEYGSSGLKALRDVAGVTRETGLPPVKACQLIACFELGSRLFAQADGGGGVFTIRTPGDVYTRLKDMAELHKEQLRGLYLNARNKVIYQETVSIGTLTANLVHPADVFRPAIERAAAGVIIAHNHPSGDPEPSDHDLAITAQLAQAASILSIKLIDHVIIGGGQFVSLREKGVL